MSDAQTQQNTTPKRQPHKWEKVFISSLASSGVVSAACVAAKINRSTAYDNRKAHEDFAQAWDEALEIAADMLELEARRRAHDGVDEPVYYKGVEMGKIRKYSDTLLIFLLKGARPEKFRENFDHTLHGPNNGAIQVETFATNLNRSYGDPDGR